MLNQSEFATLNTYMVGIDCLTQIRKTLWKQDGILLTPKYNVPSTFVLSSYILPFSLVSEKEDGSKIRPTYLSEVECVIAADRILSWNASFFDNWFENIEEFDGFINPTSPAGDGIKTPIFQVNQYSDANSVVAKYIFTKPIINGLFKDDYTDYSTITSYYIFLPYIGYVDIDYFNIRNGFIIEYSLDLTNGVMVCNMYRGNYTTEQEEEYFTAENKRFYSTSINIGIPITLTGGDLSIERNRNLSRLTSAVNFASGALSLIPGLGAVSNSVRDTTSSTVKHGGNEYNMRGHRETKLNKKTNRQITAKTSTTSSEKIKDPQYIDSSRTSSQSSNYRNISASVNTAVNAIIDYWNVQSGTGHVYDIDSNTNWNSGTTPILYARRPKVIESTKQSLIEYQGRPTNSVVDLNTCRGYLQVGAIHLNIDCTFDELTEIEELLFGGVIINKSADVCPDIIIDTYENESTETESTTSE